MSRDGRGGADYLARIHGTEEDRVNCPFYFKIGACRHGDKCSRNHNKPTFSQTIFIPHMYRNPKVMKDSESKKYTRNSEDNDNDPEFNEFVVDVFEEVSKFGEVQDIAICDNVCDHLLGAVYIKFYDEEDADKCLTALKDRYYAGLQLKPEFSPVTDFSESRCRQYDKKKCDRGGSCNFMHIKQVPRKLDGDLFYDQPYRGHRSRSKHQY